MARLGRIQELTTETRRHRERHKTILKSEGRTGYRLQTCLSVFLCASVSLWLTALEELNGVAEQLQPVAFLLEPLACPARVLGRQHVAFGVRHQPEDAAGEVADAGDVALGAV